jgi:hypothetical protein
MTQRRVVAMLAGDCILPAASDAGRREAIRGGSRAASMRRDARSRSRRQNAVPVTIVASRQPLRSLRRSPHAGTTGTTPGNATC